MNCFSRRSLLGVALALLLAVIGGVCQTAPAQQPTIDTNEPVASLDEAVRAVNADSTLVELAVALQSARADTKIRFHEYKKGVRLFQQHHPGFYGNFFGDPFYATYDARYQRLTWKRQSAASDIDPRHSFRSNNWFFCWPSSYDPAFGGTCHGFRFAASDFFFLPSGPAFAQRRSLSKQDRRPHARPRHARNRQRRLPDATSNEPDTSGRTPSDAAERNYAAAPPASKATGGANPVKSGTPEQGNPEGENKPISPVDEIEVPDEASSRMQERASALRRRAIQTRIRREIERQYGDPETLDPRERARLTKRLAERNYSPDERADESPQILDGTGRIDRSEIRNRIRQRDRQRPTPESNEHRPAPDDREEAQTTNVNPPAPASPNRSTPNRSTPNRNAVDRADGGSEPDEHKDR